MKIKRKAGYIPVLAVMAAFTVAPVSNAMHIMEGFLAPAYCIAWGLVCVPFIVLGLRSISRIVERDRKTMLLIAMCAAFAFVLSALKIPSVTGSCSHPTGVGLGAVFFGPLATSVFGLIVLLFQALLLGHGGITTLGANVFSMAIVGPFVSYGVYRLVKKLHGNQYAGVFLAAALGDLATYCVTSVQLGLAYPSPEGGVIGAVIEFLGVFALTQIPLAVAEGIVTVFIFNLIAKYGADETKSLDVFYEKGGAVR